MGYNISQHKEQNILTLYSNGFNMKQIANQLDLHYTTVSRFLKKSHIEIKRRRYEFNESYFDEINSPDKAYWLGFIFADGSISCQHGLRISLKYADVSHLEKLMDCLAFIQRPPIKVRVIKDKKYACLKITSKKLFSGLVKSGINSDKTKNPQNIIPIHFKWDFIRGFFDGDGCLYYQLVNGGIRNITSYFTVHENLIDSLTDAMNDVIPKNKWSITSHWRTSYIRSLRINGYKNCIPFLDQIYINCDIFLERKFQKYIQLRNQLMESSSSSTIPISPLSS